jgi:DNA (cytosine-5)-methyltransferase 3A
VAKDKAYCLKHQAGNARDYFKKHHTDIKFEAVNITADGKSQCLRASCYKDGIRNLVGNDVDRRTGVAESVCVAQRGRYSDSGNRTVKGNGPIEQYYEARDDGKTNALTTVQKDNAVCEPVRVGCMPSPDGELKNSQAFRLYSTDGKSVNLTSGGGGAGGKTGLYAIQVDDREPRCYATPCEWDEDGRPIKAVSCADGKVYTVYEVKDGKITIKGKEYPIKLVDGYYIIRKLTVRECMRLQTVPEWYEFPVSDTQAYKMLGNGWTVEVIRHLIRCAVKGGEKND